MSRRPMLPLVLGLAMLLGTLVLAVPAGSQTPKRGGILNSVLIEDPPELLIHELDEDHGGFREAECAVARDHGGRADRQ